MHRQSPNLNCHMLPTGKQTIHSTYTYTTKDYDIQSVGIGVKQNPRIEEKYTTIKTGWSNKIGSNLGVQILYDPPYL